MFKMFSITASVFFQNGFYDLKIEHYYNIFPLVAKISKSYFHKVCCISNQGMANHSRGTHLIINKESDWSKTSEGQLCNPGHK